MFIPERPIETKAHDFLKRANFSETIAKGIISWSENDSLVISLNGKWGAGKTSILNLIKEEIRENDKDRKVSIIEFNPWMFSETGDITSQFFIDISKSIKKAAPKNGAAIANKIRLYSKILDLKEVSEKSPNLLSKIILPIGILGISLGQAFTILTADSLYFGKAMVIIGAAFGILEVLRLSINKIADTIEAIGPSERKTVLELKDEIKADLAKQEKRLLILIDDIDRLTPKEALEIFKLIRINADFPNTIYLISFDREIIEKNVTDLLSLPGKDFLEKIIQVNFDVPFTREGKIHAYLLSEIDTIVKSLPESAPDFFKETDPYWSSIFYGGLKDFFATIRDVKRFASSLKINLSIINKNDTIEINPIDFIAIEAIRVFLPKYFEFVKNSKHLFITDSKSIVRPKNEEIKKSLDEGLLLIPQVRRESVKKLMITLFPRLESIYSTHSYSSGTQMKWARDLRACFEDHFDAYFTMVPGGDEEELNQFDIQTLFSTQSDKEKFRSLLTNAIDSGSIRKYLRKIQFYTDDRNIIKPENYPIVIETLFDIAELIPKGRGGFFDSGADIEIARIVYQLLSTGQNKEENAAILEAAINNTTGTFGPLYHLTFDLEREKEGGFEDSTIPLESFQRLKKIVSDKTKAASAGPDFLKNERILSILFFMKQLGENKFVSDFLEEAFKTDEGFILITRRHVTEIWSSSGRRKKFNRSDIEKHFSIDEFKARLSKIKKSQLYEVYREDIDFMLTHADLPDRD